MMRPAPSRTRAPLHARGDAEPDRRRLEPRVRAGSSVGHWFICGRPQSSELTSCGLEDPLPRGHVRAAAKRWWGEPAMVQRDRTWVGGWPGT